MRQTLLAALLLTFLAVGSSADASWIFGRSYYSHDDVKPTTVGDRYQGGPYTTPPQGAYFRSSYRYINGTIYTGRGGVDREIIREGYIQFGRQY